jgi:hypothetical protein
MVLIILLSAVIFWGPAVASVVTGITWVFRKLASQLRTGDGVVVQPRISLTQIFRTTYLLVVVALLVTSLFFIGDPSAMRP